MPSLGYSQAPLPCSPAQRPGQLGGTGGRAAHPDVARAIEVGRDRAAHLLPVGLPGGDHGDLAGPGLAQPGLPGLAQRPPHRVQHGVVPPSAPLALDQHHPVWAAQIVVQRLGPDQRVFVIGPGQQVTDQVAAQPEFGVGDAAQPG